MKFINKSEERLRCGIIGFNPNKCHKHEYIIDEVEQFCPLLRVIILNILILLLIFQSIRYWYICLRTNVHSLYKSSKDSSTKYLGKKWNDPGYVKLCNKNRESGLPSTWTRIEITIGVRHCQIWDKSFTILKRCYLNCYSVILKKRCIGIASDVRKKLN